MTDASAVNLFSPEVFADPFAVYDSIREKAPIIPIRQPKQNRDMFLVTSHSLAQEILKDFETFSSQFNSILLGGSAPNPEAEAIYAMGWPEIDVILTSDPPRHKRYRSLAMQAFSPKRIAAMESQIIDAIDTLIDQFIERGECDFIREFAVPLPTYMICDMLGIDRSMVTTVWRWSNAFMLRNGQMGTKEEEIEAARAIVDCQKFLHEMIQVRRGTPMNDMVSDLVHARTIDDEPLTELELLSTLQTLVIGGNETTRNALIGMMANLLGPFRDQYELLLNDRSLCKNAAEETLRFHSPISATWRIATRDIEIGGVMVPKGATVMCRLDAANHDPGSFAEPEQFDIQRKNASRHLTFGMGIHTCIGNVLARRELNLALPRLLDRLGNMKIIKEKSDLRIHPSIHTRATRDLHISFDPGKPLTARVQ